MTSARVCGEDVLTFSRAVGKTGRVIAVEAHPVSFAFLKNFCRLNGLANILPLHVALMDKTGIVHIAASDSAWYESAVEFGGGSSAIHVQADTLDSVCKFHGVKDIAFLKMNIEGTERYALLGMDATIPYIREICVACHDFRADWGHGEQFRTRAFVKPFLTQCGFAIRSRPDDPRDYVRDHIFGIRQR